MIAVELREWLKCIMNATEPFVSSEDITKGRRWLIEISKSLEESNFGIICLTPENLNSRWLLFEAGALSKRLDANVCTLLTGGLTPENIDGPLSHLQHTRLEKEDFWKLILSINSSLEDSKLEENTLKRSFEHWWPNLKDQIDHIYETSDEQIIEERSPAEMLSEVLHLSRYIAKNIDSPDSVTEETRRLKKLLNLGIVDIELSRETTKALGDLKTASVGVIAQMSAYELDALYDFTEDAISEIQDKLEELGLSLGMKIDKRLFN
jgi:hypothetical protein